MAWVWELALAWALELVLAWVLALVLESASSMLLAKGSASALELHCWCHRTPPNSKLNSIQVSLPEIYAYRILPSLVNLLPTMHELTPSATSAWADGRTFNLVLRLNWGDLAEL